MLSIHSKDQAYALRTKANNVLYSGNENDLPQTDHHVKLNPRPFQVSIVLARV